MDFKETQIGKIPVDWELYELKDKVNIVMGQSPKSEFYNKNKEGIPFMQGRTTFGDKYHEIDTWCTDPKKFANKSEVLMSVRAPVGDVNIATMDLCIGRGLASLSMKNGNNEYLYYLMKNYVDIITSKGSGTVFSSVNKNDIETLKLPFASDEEQKAIANILSSLDEKIELNNQMNKTLEEMAQALFKRWFVDFEFPNENGEPYKSSGGEMVDSELGMIPKGWGVLELKNMVKQIKPGTNYQPKRLVEGIPFLNVRNINTGYIDLEGAKFISEEDYNKVHKTWKPEKGDILISRIGTLGLVAVIREQDLPVAVHYNFIDIKVDDEQRGYFYFLLKSNYFQSKYHSIKKASVQEYVTIDEVEKIKIVGLENSNLQMKFNVILEKILEIQKENQYLTTIRNTLLPKLMSGEVRVTDLQN